MLENDESFEKNKDKLLRMGFSDEQRVAKTLSAVENDLDRAISILVGSKTMPMVNGVSIIRVYIVYLYCKIFELLFVHTHT